jgi:hypothetical protein
LDEDGNRMLTFAQARKRTVAPRLAGAGAGAD